MDWETNYGQPRHLLAQGHGADIPSTRGHWSNRLSEAALLDHPGGGDPGIDIHPRPEYPEKWRANQREDLSDRSLEGLGSDSG